MDELGALRPEGTPLPGRVASPPFQHPSVSGLAGSSQANHRMCAKCPWAPPAHSPVPTGEAQRGASEGACRPGPAAAAKGPRRVGGLASGSSSPVARLPLPPNGAAHLLSSVRTSACPQWGSGGLCPAAASSWPQWAWQPAGSCSPRPAWAPAPGLRRRNLRPSSDPAGAKPPRRRLQHPGAAAGRCFFKKNRTYSAENIPTEIIQFHLQNRGFMQKLSVI